MRRGASGSEVSAAAEQGWLPQKRRGCWNWGAVLLAVSLVVFLLFMRSQLAPTAPDPRLDFIAQCGRELKAQLEAHVTADLSDVLTDGVLGTTAGYVWNGSVAVENGAGAITRTRFKCQGRSGDLTVTFD